MKNNRHRQTVRQIKRALIFVVLIESFVLANDADLKKLCSNLYQSFISQSAEKIAAEADKAVSSMSVEGSWPDVDYHQPAPSGGQWSAGRHFDRMLDMSKAYVKQGQKFYKNRKLKEKIEKSIVYFHNNVFTRDGKRPTKQQQGNWWYWNFGIPMNMGQMLILLRDEIDRDIYRRLSEDIKWSLNNPLDHDLKGFVGGAANSIWSAKANLFFYASKGDGEAVKYIIKQVAKNYQIMYAPREGINEDMSFRAHWMIDFSGYYRSYLTDPLIFIEDYLAGTAYQFPKRIIELLAENVYQGALWVLWKGYADIGVRGRGLDGPFDKAEHIFNAVNTFSSVKNAYRNRFEKIKPQLENGLQIKYGHKHFWMSDFTVHKGKHWYAGLRMNSSRNIASESFGGRGKTTAYYSDGAMWIQLEDEYFSNSSFAALDWDMLPGTTLAKGAVPYRYRSYIMGSEPFVGGCFTADNGVSAMQLSKISIPLRAKKSWFFFDDEIVCLGSDINYGEKEKTITVVNQRPEIKTEPIYIDQSTLRLKDKTLKTDDIRWIQHNDIGYVFPGNQSLVIERRRQSGSWADLSSGMSPQKHTLDFVLFVLEHGSNTVDGSYAYAVVPRKNKQDMSEYADDKQFEILNNSKYVHSVRDISSGAVGAVFWSTKTDYASVHFDLPYAGRAFYDDGMVSKTHPKMQPVIIEKHGIKGAANKNKDQNLLFAVNAQRVQPGDAVVTIKWFDDANARQGSNFKIAYNSSRGKRKSRAVKYQFTNKWVVSRILLEDADFSDFFYDGCNLELIHNKSLLEGSDQTSKAYGVLVSRILIEPAGNKIAYSPSENYQAGIVSSDKPCVVCYKLDNDYFSISLADPAFEENIISLEVDLRLKAVDLSDGISCRLKGNKTAITFKTKYGRSYVGTFLVR